jgi:hypothetical protein
LQGFVICFLFVIWSIIESLQDFVICYKVYYRISQDFSGAGRRLVATDGVFSMDGDVAPIREICDLADKHNALVFVDECHASMLKLFAIFFAMPTKPKYYHLSTFSWFLRKARPWHRRIPWYV